MFTGTDSVPEQDSRTATAPWASPHRRRRPQSSHDARCPSCCPEHGSATLPPEQALHGSRREEVWQQPDTVHWFH